jgi:hypothetical protein
MPLRVNQNVRPIRLNNRAVSALFSSSREGFSLQDHVAEWRTEHEIASGTRVTPYLRFTVGLNHAMFRAQE